MALAAGLGVIPFLFVKKVSDRLIGISNAAAAGVMLTASFGMSFLFFVFCTSFEHAVLCRLCALSLFLPFNLLLSCSLHSHGMLFFV